MKKVIVLERQIGSRLHKTRLQGNVSMHIELVDRLYERCLKWKMKLDIEELCSQVKGKENE